jgi:Zn-dependent protease
MTNAAYTPPRPRRHVVEGTVSLGHIAGVEVRVQWTAGVTASLIALGLADGVFPSAVGGLSTGAYYAMGVVTALLFFVSLLLHELGHALRARREGIPTRAITLWMLGGVAQGETDFAQPGTEARVALAGPAVSAVLGVVLVAAGQLSALSPTVAVIVQWLGWTNLLLLAFNMLPALPLDGGRVLRAALWRRTGSRLRATRAAVRVSRALSAGLIALGLLGFVAGGGFGALWIALIGGFLRSAAAAELRAEGNP